MAHFSKVLNGKVVELIVADQEFIDNYIDTSPGTWIKTSYLCGVRELALNILILILLEKSGRLIQQWYLIGKKAVLDMMIMNPIFHP